uniref:CH-like domain-containing protein n=1 Tax=Rhinolophus ferrumequinum TaxID=59479 RepID=A0A671ELC5_RHIFE
MQGAARPSPPAPPLLPGVLRGLYAWLDRLPLSRPKRRLARDFSDGVMLAEIVKHFHPQLVDLHNYVPTCNTDQKLSNWSVLNRQAPGRLLRPAPPCRLPSLPLLEPPPPTSISEGPPSTVGLGGPPLPSPSWSLGHVLRLFPCSGFPHPLLSVSVPVPWDLGFPHPLLSVCSCPLGSHHQSGGSLSRGQHWSPCNPLAVCLAHANHTSHSLTQQ